MRRMILMICVTLVITICFLAGPSLASAKLKEAARVRSGLIKSPRHIHSRNSGDRSGFGISVVFPRSLRQVWTGEADAWLIILPYADTAEEVQGDLPVIKLTGDDALFDSDLTSESGGATHKPKQSFTIPWEDLRDLPGGTYQVGLVLTVKGSTDPTVLGNWYGGFSGLVSVTSLTIPAQPDTEDQEAGDDTQDGDDGSEQQDPGTVIPY